MEEETPQDRETPEKETPTVQETPRWRSEELLGDGKEALIVHNEQVYRLCRTRNGKLILLK